MTSNKVVLPKIVLPKILRRRLNALKHSAILAAVASVGVAIFLFAPAIVRGQTVYTWNGGSDVNWNNSANWGGSAIATTNGSYNARITVAGATNPLSYTAGEGYTTYIPVGGSTSGRALVLASGAGVSGAMTIYGGTFESRGSAPDIIGNSGVGGNAVGTLTLAGGNYVNTNAAAFQELVMGFAGNNTATLNVNSGSASVGLITFGNSSSQISTNIINLNGGTLAVDSIAFTPAYIGASNYATINFNGGTLRAIGAAGSFTNLAGISNIVNVTAVNVFSNGAVIDTQGFNASTTNALLHGGAGTDGGLTKLGSGILTLSGASSYNGPTVISAGVLKLTGSLGTGSYAGAISNNGTFFYGGSSVQTLSGIVSGSGGVTVSGGGTLNLSGADTYTGPTVISNGVLNVTTAGTGGGWYTNLNGTTLGVTVAAAGQTLALSSYSLANSCTNAFNLGSFGNPTNPVLYATNLVVAGTNMINLSGANVSLGQFTLIKYVSALGVTSGSFVTNALPTGMIAFVSNNVANASIDLVVTRCIPVAALNDPLYSLGYLVVTDYPGVTNDGSSDCTVGIQAALDDAYTANQTYQIAFVNETAETNYVLPFTNRPVAVFFPPGIYVISNTLTCYEWTDTNETPKYGFDCLIGSTAGSVRPKIILAAGAANFQSTNAPQQMISFRNFKGSNGSPVPVPNPMSSPTNYVDWGAGNMNGPELRNIDFDCNSNAGAVGVVFTGAQGCSLENVKVSATNAFAGFYMLPGAGACAANLEVDGGQYGVIHGRYSSLGLNIAAADSGPTVVGLTLANQTVTALKFFDEDAPMTLVGFDITNCQNIAVQTVNYDSSSDGTMTLLDGQIEMAGTNNPVAINNSVGKNFYARNVYVSGTTNLIESGTNVTTGAGAWPQIAEYSYNDPVKVTGVPPNTNYAVNTVILESYSVINGAVQNYTVPFPISPSVLSNNVAPSVNFVSEHLWQTFPSYNGATNDSATVVVSTNAGWNNPNDATAILQAAIDAAETNNGRVFLPAGIYYITNTLILHTNTVLMGVGRQLTCIEASPFWQPTNGVATMIQTENSATANTTLAYLSIAPRKILQLSETNFSRFNELTWQAGSNSVVLAVDPVEFYTWTTNTQPRSLVVYTNNGGGQWYSLCLAGSTGESNPGFQKVGINGTSQPLWFYGFNLEHGAGNVEAGIQQSSNVRLLGLKREGSTPLLVMTNCTNIAAYGFGRAVSAPAGNGYFQILGNSTNILLANLTVYAPSTAPGMTGNMLYEALNGYPVTNVLWPNMVSLYKRGEIDDTLMFLLVSTSKKINVFLAQSVPIRELQITTTGNQATISWLTGGTLESADNVAGPYIPIDGASSPYTITITTNRSEFFRVVK